MKSSGKKYKKDKVISFEFKAAPMAQLKALEKKIKKADTAELAKMYNEKCFKLYQDIENLNTEIDNYKSIINQLQIELRNKSTETPSADEPKEDAPQKKDPDVSTKDFEEQIVLLQKQISNMSKVITSLQGENQNLSEQIVQKDKKISQLSSQVKTKFERKESKQLTPTTESEIKQQLNDVLIENLFLMYLLDRSANYEKSIKEINENFEHYFDFYIKQNRAVDNIFSSIIHEFLYRIHKRSNFQILSAAIFNKNSITQSEEYNMRYTESPFFTTNLVNDDMMVELNKKIYVYRNDSITQIQNLINKIHDKIQTSPDLISLKKFEISTLFSYNTKAHLRINLNKFTCENAPFLINSVKYAENDVKSFEFYGEIKYDKEGKCDEVMQVMYQLATNYKDKIGEFSFTQLKNVKPEFIKCVNYIIENLDNVKKITFSSSELTDDLFDTIKFKPAPYEYLKLDFSNNKLTKLTPFKTILAKQLILSGNPIKFQSGDSEIKLVYLDISNCKIDIKNFSEAMKDSKVQILNLSGAKITEQTCELFINTIASFRLLKILYLDSLDIAPKSYPTFIPGLKELKLLELYFNEIKSMQDKEAKMFMEEYLGNCKELLKLEMKKCNIGAEGVAAMCKAVESNDVIKEINIEGNNVNREEVDKLLGDKKDKIKIII